jgi:hypothetical protein
MRDISDHLDLGSKVVIVVTFVLFAAAVWMKGIGHEILLEGGVFLVSVKLILMAYKNSVAGRRLDARLGRIEALMAQAAEAKKQTGTGGM